VKEGKNDNFNYIWIVFFINMTLYVSERVNAYCSVLIFQVYKLMNDK